MRKQDLTQIIHSGEGIKERYLYCIDKKVDLSKFADDFFASTGVKVQAKIVPSTVNGALVSQYVAKGSGGVGWCGKEILESEEHTCMILFMYKESKTSEKVNIARKSMTTAVKKKIDDFFTSEKLYLVEKKE